MHNLYALKCASRIPAFYWAMIGRPFGVERLFVLATSNNPFVNLAIENWYNLCLNFRGIFISCCLKLKWLFYKGFSSMLRQTRAFCGKTNRLSLLGGIKIQLWNAMLTFVERQTLKLPEEAAAEVLFFTYESFLCECLFDLIFGCRISAM